MHGEEALLTDRSVVSLLCVCVCVCEIEREGEGKVELSQSMCCVWLYNEIRFYPF